MSARYQRPAKSDYTSRAARSEAKKVILEMLANVLRDSAICGYERTIIDCEVFAECISHWPGHRWRHGALEQMDAAAMELMDEFRRRAER